MGTRVVCRQALPEAVEIELPGGARGWVRAETLRAGGAPWPATPEAILATLHEFVGVPYVWGGKSPKGFDCSGLVQFVFGVHGVPLPRDSDQQFGCGTPVRWVDLKGSGLYFCNCGGACKCNSISDKPAECRCAMQLKRDN